MRVQMAFALPRLVRSSSRLLHSTGAATATATATETATAKVPVALISKIRALRPGTPLTLARSALLASENDLDRALACIAEQAAASGAAKAKKLEGRTAEQGLVGVAMLADGTGGLGVRGAMVELSCETDFVARTDEFRELLESIARSLAFFAEPEPAPPALLQLTTHTPTSLADLPLLPPPSASSAPTPLVDGSLPTIASAIATTVSRLGENISLRRAVSVAVEPVRPGSTLHFASSYLHGAQPSSASASASASFSSGTIASLLVFKLPCGGQVDKPALTAFARAIARQVVAVPTTSVRTDGSDKGDDEVSTVLYEQPLMTLSSSDKLEFEQGTLVGSVLRKWSDQAGVDGEGLQVLELRRWEVGGAQEP